jgi:glyoxylase-like metal-dependent hydrolase (beta-lactamase superfamily II)
MVDTKEVAENIYLIDDQLYSIPKWGSVYFVNETKKALIDTGPTTSASAVLDGIRKIGVSPEDIDYLVVTHIHLDHAGGAGFLLKNMPGAQVVVHQKGAKHLAAPEKLVSSFAAAMGQEMMAKVGEVVPIEVERINPVDDNDVLELGKGQTLKFIHSPGHAPHELCIWESRNNGLFSGDGIGISVADNEVLLPVTPPPSFDLEIYLDTLKRLMVLPVQMIYFAHFGASHKVEESLQIASDKLQLWNGIIANAVAENGFDGAAVKLQAQICAELEPVKKMDALYKYLTGGLALLNVAGYLKYYREKHGAN